MLVNLSSMKKNPSLEIRPAANLGMENLSGPLVSKKNNTRHRPSYSQKNMQKY